MHDSTPAPPARRFPFAAIPFVLALVAAAALLLGADERDGDPAGTTRHAVGADSRFGHVAVFAAGTSGAAIEQWRRDVLARTHAQACAGGRPCLQRSLRLSAVGAAAAEVLAFDLAAETPDAERDALLAAAARTQPRAQLRHDTTPRLAALGH